MKTTAQTTRYRDVVNDKRVEKKAALVMAKKLAGKLGGMKGSMDKKGPAVKKSHVVKRQAAKAKKAKFI